MANLVAHKDASAPFSNSKEKVEIAYDFASDGGAIGILDAMTFAAACIITRFYFKCETAFTSAGAVVVDFGIKGGATEALLKDQLKAAFAAGAVVYDKTNQILPLKVAAGTVLSMEISDFALTAGKGKFVIEYEKF